ncbi:MAG TPA: hypothetical protein VHM24_00805 [Gemmatimonadaceae bacterium]|nr:hypothetical protein [Gemmatimonadaceae bacterium]
MRYLKLTFILALSVAAGSCSDGSQSPSTAPLIRRAVVTTTAACDAGAGAAISAQQIELFAPGPSLAHAQSFWAAVVAACSASNPDAANAQLLEYVRFILTQWPTAILTPVSGDKETNFLAHIDAVFLYVGYPAPALPHSSNGGPLGPDGGLKVISQTDTDRELRVPDAALTLPVQDGAGDARAHLFALFPDPSACTLENLDQVGPCYEAASYPSVSPLWSPKIKVGVCVPVSEGDPEASAANIPALGHLTGGVTEIAGNLPYPADCGTHVAENTGSWSGGIGGIVTRLAWFGKRAFGVNTAYAAHSGLGGVGEGLSPWIGVDLEVFNAPVDVGPNVIGAFPAPPETGAWDPASFATPPGSIEVKSSLGTYGSPLIVMRHAGGACTKKCGGLLLRANLFSASGVPAQNGIYEVTFLAIQDFPSVKDGPFVATDAEGRELGRVSFVTRNAKRQLIMNYHPTTGAGLVVGEWQRDVPQTFKFVINLNAGSKSFTLFVGNETTGHTAPFENPAASSLAHLAFDAQGIDAGLMGWDNIHVQRLPDN